MQPRSNDDPPSDQNVLSSVPTSRLPRRHLGVPIVLHSIESHPGTALDVSEHGLFATLDDILPVHSVVEVEFQLPHNSHAFRVLGEICLVHLYSFDDDEATGVGIDFHHVGGETREKLATVVGTHLKRHGTSPPPSRFIP